MPPSLRIFKNPIRGDLIRSSPSQNLKKVECPPPYLHVCIRRGGGLGLISKLLQEGGHFLIRGGSDKPKMLQEGGLDRRGRSNTLHYKTVSFF